MSTPVDSAQQTTDRDDRRADHAVHVMAAPRTFDNNSVVDPARVTA